MATRKDELYASLNPYNPRWYVVAIMPSMEATASEHLSRQGFEHCIPMQLERIIDKHSKIVETRHPRFRGYGFVRLDLDVDRWRSVNGTRGVRHLLPLHHERPLPLPVGFVEELKAQPEKAEEIVALFASNEMVRVLAGAWAGQQAKTLDQRQGGDVQIAFDNGMKAWVPPYILERN